MPGAAEGPELLADTSVAVAIALADHPHHEATLAAVGRRRLGLAGHAAFETFSVLTRMPAPSRRPGDVVARLLMHNFPHSRHLTPAEAEALLRELPERGISGGAVYDALIGAVARAQRVPLVSRDRRAVDTYRVLGAAVEMIA